MLGAIMATKKESDKYRLYVDVNYATLRKLLLWAFSRGDSKNGWTRTVITLRCEENYPKTQAWLEREASNLGVPVKELENRILNKMGFDFQAYRKEMLDD